MRDIGYSLETAIADIIDNSITANASRVEILVDTNAELPVLGILDNGKGMSREELFDAMRLGSTSPRDVRSKTDLGRFGLGLKTASFSQCRELTVISKQKGELSGAVWDLDVVSEDDDWQIGIPDKSYMDKLPYVEQLTRDGTLVLWRKLDRLYDSEKGNTDAEVHEKLKAVDHHLALVFHRFLNPELPQKKLDISMNCHQIEAFDPFCLKHSATQKLHRQAVQINGYPVIIQPYILPHHSKLSPETHAYYQNRSEFFSNQGVYVYRNKRLMAWGGWFRLAPKEEIAKLARVRIDFPNTLDEYWTIDIKKSKASPPPQVKDELRQIISRITEKSVRVIEGRGERLLGKTLPLWTRRAEREGIKYALNEEHPLLQAVNQSLDSTKQKLFSEVLQVVGRSIPIETIYSDYADSPKKFEDDEKMDSEEVMTKLRMLYDSLSDGRNLSGEEFKEILGHLKPFCEYPEQIDAIIEEEINA